MHRIHEVSRRRNGECGLDVIVAAARQRQGLHHKRQPIITAEEASQKLVQLAREIDPNGALATHSTFEDVPQTAEVAGVDEDLRLRAPDLACLQPFEAGMRAFWRRLAACKTSRRRRKSGTFGAGTTRWTPASPLR